jgi:putative transposase
LSREAMYQSGTGFKNIILKVYHQKEKKISKLIVDETVIKVGSELIWLWAAIEPKNKEILALNISKERNMFVAERFLFGLVNKYQNHPTVSTDGGTWYPQACRFLKLPHHIHSSYEKSIIERTKQYIKDRTESFDDYFPCSKEKCNLFHIKNWFKLFLNMHNKEVINAYVNRAKIIYYVLNSKYFVLFITFILTNQV